MLRESLSKASRIRYQADAACLCTFSAFRDFPLLWGVVEHYPSDRPGISPECHLESGVSVWLRSSPAVHAEFKKTVDRPRHGWPFTLQTNNTPKANTVTPYSTWGPDAAFVWRLVSKLKRSLTIRADEIASSGSLCTKKRPQHFAGRRGRRQRVVT
jgi:hypothetical protein